MAYVPTNHYWSVGGDTANVWSSASFTYVSTSDLTYQTWLNASNSPTNTASAADLSLVAQTQVLPAFFDSATIDVTSNLNSSLNSSYSIDRNTLSQVGEVARDVASGLGLPLEADAFQYPDAIGVLKTFGPEDIKNLYKAMRDYIALFSYTVQVIVMGNNIPLPSTNITIP